MWQQRAKDAEYKLVQVWGIVWRCDRCVEILSRCEWGGRLLHSQQVQVHARPAPTHYPPPTLSYPQVCSLLIGAPDPLPFFDSVAGLTARVVGETEEWASRGEDEAQEGEWVWGLPRS